MPYKSGKLKGQLTAAEIRKLIRAHNKLVSIKIPPKTDRDGLIALVQKHGYKIDHENQEIRATTRPRKPNVTLKQAETVTKPKPLTEEQKKKRAENKKKKEEKVKKREGDLIKAGATIQRAVAKKKLKKVEPKKEEKKERTPYKSVLKVEFEGKKEDLSIEKLVEKLEELGFKPSQGQEKKFKDWYYKRGRHVKILQIKTTADKLTITPVYAKRDEKGKVIKGEGKGVAEMGSAYQDQAVMKTIIKKGKSESTEKEKEPKDIVIGTKDKMETYTLERDNSIVYLKVNPKGKMKGNVILELILSHKDKKKPITPKGKTRKYLCELLEYLISVGKTSPNNKIKLEASETFGVENFDAEKLINMYEKMSFKIKKKNYRKNAYKKLVKPKQLVGADMETTIGELMSWCKNH